MSAQRDGVSEIQNYIGDISFQNVLDKPEIKQSFSRAYKYVHALLIWDHALSTSTSPEVDKLARLQFKELLSDLAGCQVLLLLGMYKPSRMMLRSAIENLFRTVAHEQGFLASGAKFTHELITLVRSSKIGVTGAPARPEIDYLVQTYSRLCEYVHAADETKLALRVPLSQVSKFDCSEHENLNTEIKGACQRINRIMFILYSARLRSIHHSQSDFVLDTLPKTLKSLQIT